MKYEIRYGGPKPSDHDVMELMVAIGSVNGEECEQITLIHDGHVAPGVVYMLPVPDNHGDEWKGE